MCLSFFSHYLGRLSLRSLRSQDMVPWLMLAAVTHKIKGNMLRIYTWAFFSTHSSHCTLLGTSTKVQTKTKAPSHRHWCCTRWIPLFWGVTWEKSVTETTSKKCSEIFSEHFFLLSQYTLHEAQNHKASKQSKLSFPLHSIAAPSSRHCKQDDLGGHWCHLLCFTSLGI